MPTTYDELVLDLHKVEGREATILALRHGGESAKPALLRGLKHPAWRVRHGCLRVLDHTIIDDPTRDAVFKALKDPHRKVRRAAMHALGCEVCKPEGYCGIEGVDLEAVWLEIARNDRSSTIRALATGALRWQFSRAERVEETLRDILANDDNAEVRRRAARALSG